MTLNYQHDLYKNTQYIQGFVQKNLEETLEAKKSTTPFSPHKLVALLKNIALQLLLNRSAIFQ